MSEVQTRCTRSSTPRSMRPPPEAHDSQATSGCAARSASRRRRTPGSARAPPARRRARRCRPRAGRGCGPTSRSRSGAPRAPRAPGRRGASPTSGRVRSSTSWWRCSSGVRGSPAARIQSGCARKRSESGLTISGSNQSPNSMPRPRTCSTSGSSPSGQTVSSTHQSPSPAVSSRRCRNQPSSRTKRSTPTRAARSAMPRSRSRSWSKKTASQTLRTTGCARRVGWQRALLRVPARPQPVEAVVGRGDVHPGRRVRSPRRRARPRRAGAARRRRPWCRWRRRARPAAPSCRSSATWTPSTSPLVVEKPGVPSTTMVAASSPGRPPRPSRSHSPSVTVVALRGALALVAAGEVEHLDEVVGDGQHDLEARRRRTAPGRCW